MLPLPTITLFCIEVRRPYHALQAMRQSVRRCQFDSAYLLANLDQFRDIAPAAKLDGIHPVHHLESDRTHTFPGISRRYFIDYERALMTEPLRHLPDTATHLLYMEWDSGVLNPDAWTDDFLRYDFIGAPWSPHVNPGFPPCTLSNNVGNSGFCLRSRRFLEATIQAIPYHVRDPRIHSADQWMCRVMRPWFEEQGLKFAPPALASRFSCEDRIYSGQFGFHGKSTAKLNGWGDWLGDLYDHNKKPT